jgi:hypothetical protein
VAAPAFDDDGHPGWDALRFVHRLLMIDEPWTEWHDDGFTWWAHDLAQRYRWEGPSDVDGMGAGCVAAALADQPWIRGRRRVTFVSTPWHQGVWHGRRQAQERPRPARSRTPRQIGGAGATGAGV